MAGIHLFAQLVYALHNSLSLSHEHRQNCGLHGITIILGLTIGVEVKEPNVHVFNYPE